uniref:Uncharacterized protein n=1 Tax=Drosophila pseudoobscura pseudoobscura TaxID=46245 RepID=A0A0R3NXE3_DROPS
MACIVGSGGVVGERLCSGRPRCICRWYLLAFGCCCWRPLSGWCWRERLLQDLLASGGPTPGHPALT